MGIFSSFILRFVFSMALVKKATHKYSHLGLLLDLQIQLSVFKVLTEACCAGACVT